MITMIKKGSMKTAAIFTTVAMLVSIVKLPAAHAYFTAAKESEELVFILVKAEKKANANVTFIDSFLIDENEDSESEMNGEMAPMAHGMGTVDSPSVNAGVMGSLPSGSLNAADLSAGSLEALFGENLDSIEEKLLFAEKIQAEILLEDGFDAGEIYIPSVELCYGEHSAFALSGELNDDGTLVVDFDRDEIASWFEGANEEMEEVTFTVTGEGYAGGLDRFLFSGEASIMLRGSYETKETVISGSGAFFIPSPGETVEEAYLLENQNGTPLEGARWMLEDAAEINGVEIDCETGTLTVYSNAVPGAVNILAAIELENRILAARKTVELYEKPADIISGADTITIPLPEETALEQYTAEPPAGLTFTDVSWGLLEEIEGVSVDETGLVSVAGGTAADSFTLSALIEVEGVGNPLALEKEVLLETIPIGSVEVTGAERLVIPEGDFLEEQYAASVLDPEGNELEGEPVTWSLENVSAENGISIDEMGLITVEPGAEPGDYTVLATSVRDTEISGSMTVTLEAPPQEEDRSSGSGSGGSEIIEEERLVIEGKTLILIPSGDETKTFTYTAADNRQNPLDNVLFALQGEYPGVKLKENGVLTVDASAAEGRIVLLASLRGDEELGQALDEIAGGEAKEGEEDEVTKKSSLTGELIVTLALPAPSSVQISGEETVYIPVGDGEVQETAAYYTAAVLDQEGSPLEGEGVSWSLAETAAGVLAAGVLIEETGELRVTSGACPQSITIIASSLSNGELYASFEVELLFAEEETPAEDPEETEENGGDENSDFEDPPRREEDPPELEKPPENGGDDGDDGDVEEAGR
jgi:hypothetical protein